MAEAVEQVAVAGLKDHPDAGLVPDMRPDEWAAFLADVRERGVVEPLVVAGTTVLDGRHRLRAAREVGLGTVPARRVALAGEAASLYALKAAVLRRHLTDDQRAMLAAMWAKAHPRPRGGDRGNQHTGGKPASASQTTPTGGRKPEAPAPGRKEAEHPAMRAAAGLFAVAPKAVEKAAAVRSRSPALAAQVAAGALPRLPAGAWSDAPNEDGSVGRYFLVAAFPEEMVLATHGHAAPADKRAAKRAAERATARGRTGCLGFEA